jgi:uncharacterized coiled-coil protein SlyX
MYVTPDDDPVFSVGATLTTGAIRKLSDAAAEARAVMAKIDADLAGLSARLEHLEQQRRDESVLRRLIREAQQ